MEIHNIEKLDSEMRLDRYLRLIKPSLTQSFIERFLRKKLITLNEIKAKSNTRVKKGDKIEFKIDVDKDIEQNFKKPHFSEKAKILASKLTKDYLLYENENVMVINKPSNLASQSGSGIKISLDDALQYINLKENKTMLNDALRLVHRLDRETSGAFLIAKNRKTATNLTKSFENKDIKKAYLAVLSGSLKTPKGNETIYIRKNLKTKLQEFCQKDTPHSEEAITRYKVISKNEKYSLVLFYPKTGRMHQLRIFSKYLKAPIVGDKKYKGSEFQNMLLHSIAINVAEQTNGTVYAGLPDYFYSFLKENFKIKENQEQYNDFLIQSIDFENA